jgi:hypothetical protein
MTSTKQPANAASGANDDAAARIFRLMQIAVALTVVISAPWAPWRVTTGLLLGGILSLLNYRWLNNSVSAVFGRAPEGSRPKLRAAQFIIRYFVVAAAVLLSYKLNLVSLVATVAGLCSFVVALFAEAIREFYLAIINREEAG